MKTTSRAVNAALLSIIALSAVPAVNAQAGASGTYAGVGISQADVDDGVIDDDDTGFLVYGGHRFNKYFGVEGQWMDGSDIETSEGKIELRSIGAYAVGYVPVSSRFDLIGKAGWQAWDIGRRSPIIGDDSGTDIGYGVGAQYRVSDDFGLRAEWQRVEIEDIDVDTYLFSVNYSF